MQAEVISSRAGSVLNMESLFNMTPAMDGEESLQEEERTGSVLSMKETYSLANLFVSHQESQDIQKGAKIAPVFEVRDTEDLTAYKKKISGMGKVKGQLTMESEVKSHLEKNNMSLPTEGGEGTYNLEFLFAGVNPPDKCTVLKARFPIVGR